jgi:alkylated DNA repair protein alkB family protein 7
LPLYRVLTGRLIYLHLSSLRDSITRRRYERGHWDATIVKYKEVELLDEEEFFSEASRNVLNRVRSQLLEKHFASRPDVTWLPCHAIDLHAEGHLHAHVDSVRFSGDLVGGLSLLSGCIMRFRPERSDSPTDADQDRDTDGYVDLYLPPLSLYVMSGTSRYHYTHEILPDGAAFAENTVVNRDRRISIIFRDAKPDDDSTKNSKVSASSSRARTVYSV